MILADTLEKLKGFSLSRRDRELVYGALIVNGIVIMLILGAILALILKGKDPTAFKDIVANMIWAEFALVVVFVAGNVEQRRSALKALTKTPEEPK